MNAFFEDLQVKSVLIRISPHLKWTRKDTEYLYVLVKKLKLKKLKNVKKFQ